MSCVVGFMQHDNCPVSPQGKPGESFNPDAKVLGFGERRTASFVPGTEVGHEIWYENVVIFIIFAQLLSLQELAEEDDDDGDQEPDEQADEDQDAHDDELEDDDDDDDDDEAEDGDDGEDGWESASLSEEDGASDNDE